MKKVFCPITFVALTVISLVSLAGAGTPQQTGKIVSENSVDCGSKQQGKKKQTNLLCQEYVVRATDVEYHVRQPKQKDEALLPLNAPVEFSIDKDKMKLKVQGKGYEFMVVSEQAVTADAKQ